VTIEVIIGEDHGRIDQQCWGVHGNACCWAQRQMHVLEKKIRGKEKIIIIAMSSLVV
jgi:hypothetical protein